MNKKLIVATATVFLAGFCTGVHADPFDMLFRLRLINGDCHVRLPQTDTYIPPVEGKAYPYGSEIRTGHNASLVIELSPGNICRVRENAHLRMTEGKDDTSLKRVQLVRGRLDVTLENRIEESNTFQIETPAVLCEATGSEFLFEVVQEPEQLVHSIRVARGALQLFGTNFKLPLLGVDQHLRLTSSYDGSRSVRLNNQRGEFSILHRGAEDEETSTVTRPGAQLKFWRKRSDTCKLWIVTILTTDSGGKLTEEITYVEQDNALDNLRTQTVDTMPTVNYIPLPPPPRRFSFWPLRTKEQGPVSDEQQDSMQIKAVFE